MKSVLLLLIGFICIDCYGQINHDSLKSKELQEVIIKSWMRRDIDRLPEVQNNLITVGKKRN